MVNVINAVIITLGSGIVALFAVWAAKQQINWYKEKEEEMSKLTAIQYSQLREKHDNTRHDGNRVIIHKNNGSVNSSKCGKH